VDDFWPSLPNAEWAPTRRTLHMVAQMVGKTRLALAPAQPEWLNACLFLDARGLTTGAIPIGPRVATIGIDLLDPAIHLETSDGRDARIVLGPSRSVADIWRDYAAALCGLGIQAEIWEKPQEVSDFKVFSENHRDATIRADDTRRFHRVLTSVNDAFETFRSGFFGRTGVQFWWGSFDFCVLLFSGRRAPAPTDRGYILRYDLDAEHLNAGFWPGDDTTPNPQFFAYLVPEPPGCATAPMNPSHAAWSPRMGEWILAYDAVRATDDPGQTLLAFLDSVYSFATSDGGWDPEAFHYERPPANPR
jgi:hypothetical protein